MAPTYADASTNINLSNDSANMATQTDNITEDLTRNIAEQQLFEPNDTDRDLRDCLQEAASLREQLMELNQELIVMRTEIMSLQQRLVDRNGENDQLQNTIRQQSTTIKQLQGDNLRLQTDNNELHTYGTNTINELNQKLTECEQTLADHKNNQDKLIAEIENDAGNIIEEELAKNQSTSNTNKQLYAYIKYLQNTLTEANALNAQLRTQLQECIDSNNSDNLIEQIRLLTENKTTLLQETAILNDKVLNSEKLLENVTQELEHTVVTKNNDIAGLRNQLNECRADLNACNDRHENPLEFNESLCSQEFSYLFRSHKMFQVVKEFVEEIMTSINVPEQFVNEWVSQEILTKHMMDSAKDVILEKILTISAPTSNVLEETVAAVVNELNPPVVETSYIPENVSPVINTVRERSPMREENLGKNRRREKPIPVETVVSIEQPVVNTSIGQEATTIIRDGNSPDTTSIVNEEHSSPVIIRNITPVRDIVIEVDEPQSLFTKRKLETPEVSPQKRNKITTTTETTAEATDNITANDTTKIIETTKINETTNDKTITKKPGRRVTLQTVRTSPYSVPSTSSKRYPTPSTSSAPYPESRSNRLPNYVTTYTITTRPGPPTSISLSGTADEVQHMKEMLTFYRALYLNYAKLAMNTEMYIQYLDNVQRWFSILPYYCKTMPTISKAPELTVFTFDTNIPSGKVSPEQMRLMNDLTYDALNALGLLSSNLSAMEAYIDELIDYDQKLRQTTCTPDLPQLPALPDNLIPVPKFKLTKESELARFYSSRKASGRPNENLFGTTDKALSYVDRLEMKYGGGSRRKQITQSEIEWYEKAPSDMTPLKRTKKP
ncbi:ORF48 [Xestia c-nigrum granulovirus]|uniref:ORF48 n=1 Tax=Xestia c-nigrum granulosis virus TaxID=51677 RepID=Q9PYZ5_GVXN|nr:ORF48 [Xestia c-nigrum granulovirus]AAF05162.1 ORF48 [Xestia c-nigrum granulovirus]